MSAFEGLYLFPWYLNTRRLNAYAQGIIPSAAQTSLSKNSAYRADGMLTALRVANRTLTQKRIPNLAEVVDQLSEEDWQECYVWDVLTFRGVGSAITEGRSGAVSKPASFDGMVQVGDRTVKVYGILSNDHFYSASCSTLMSGRKRALLFGEMRKDENGDVEVHAIVAGTMRVTLAGDFEMNWNNRLRLYPQHIDAFKVLSENDKVTSADMKRMLTISEEEVKNKLAEIVGEPFIPKDWGGERSDLTTARMTVDGDPVSAAFIFKGPSVPGPLHPSNMGKRGDQLLRAFDEPVDIVVVQHCAKIENTVVRYAEALAANPGGPKQYCILDGADTFRLLRAHGKLPPQNSN